MADLAGDTKVRGNLIVEGEIDLSAANKLTNINPEGPLSVQASVTVDSLGATGWNWVDAHAEGANGDRTGTSLDTIISNNPDSVILLRPGNNYNMGNLRLANYNCLGIYCPSPETARIHANDARMIEFLDLGGHGTSDHGGATWVENITFVNHADQTDANGDRFDAGLVKGAFHEDALFKNVHFEGARHRLEDISAQANTTGGSRYEDPDGDGTYEILEHGSRYQIRTEAAERSAHVVWDRLHMPDGGTEESVNGTATGHAIGFANETHYGKIEIINSYIEGFVDNGLYVTQDPLATYQDTDPFEDGEVIVKNSTIKNCSNSCLRIGWNQKVENCRIVLDNTNNNVYQGIGLHVQDGTNAQVDGLRIKVTNHSNDVVRLNDLSDRGDIRNVWITNDTSNRVLEAGEEPLNKAPLNDNRGFVLRNWLVDDTAAPTSFAAPIAVMRDDLTFENCIIHAPNRNAVRADRAFNMYNCNLQSDPTREGSIRLGRYFDSAVTGPNQVVRIRDCDFSNGAMPIYMEPQVFLDTLIVEGNDMREANWNGKDAMADINGVIGTLVWKNNLGFEKPDTTNIDVRRVRDTDRSVEAYPGPTPFQWSAKGEQIFNMQNNRWIGNIGNNWQDVQNGGSAGWIFDGENPTAWDQASNFSTSSAAAHDGTNGIFIDGAGVASGASYLEEGNAPNNLPKKGHKFEYWVNPQAAGAYFRLFFARQDVGQATSNSILIQHLFGSGDNMEIYEYVGGTSTKILDSDLVGWTLSSWFRVQVEWLDDGTDDLVFTVDTGRGSAALMTGRTTPTTGGFRGGGITLAVDGSTSAYIDSARIFP